MTALEMRAQRWSNKYQRKDLDDELFDAAVDETGTVATEDITLSDSESLGDVRAFGEERDLEVREFLEMK